MGRDRPRAPEERRKHPRFQATAVRVDYSTGDHFLFAPIENISAMGIFIRTAHVFPVGTRMQLAFALEGGTERLSLEGEVCWINEREDESRERRSRGMGVRFTSLRHDQREAVLELIRALAYVH